VASPSTVELVQSRFRGLFGTDAHIFRAPGRVNLIGEHTDYNDGFVMPTSIGLHTSVAAAKREDRRLEVYSDHFNERISLSLDDLSGGPRGHWSDFIRGVAAILKHAGHSLTGANLAINADVPLGAGLGSSASLEIAVALALTSLSEIALSRPEWPSSVRQPNMNMWEPTAGLWISLAPVWASSDTRSCWTAARSTTGCFRSLLA